jgi:hypothetical protein
MDSELLQKLLPSEVSDYYIRNQVRSDGRSLLQHRGYHMVRNVLALAKKS